MLLSVFLKVRSVGQDFIDSALQLFQVRVLNALSVNKGVIVTFRIIANFYITMINDFVC